MQPQTVRFYQPQKVYFYSQRTIEMEMSDDRVELSWQGLTSHSTHFRSFQRQ